MPDVWSLIEWLGEAAAELEPAGAVPEAVRAPLPEHVEDPG
jgi:hypothetical protein